MGYRGLSNYEHWRRGATSAGVCEEGQGEVPERALQVIWQQQRLKPELRLGDGRLVKVWHPGFWNYEAGPDFRDAMIQIGDDPVRRGDVEIDVALSCWKAHGHDRNPAFANTVLRVVFALPGGSEESVLPLKPHLDASWSSLLEWAMMEPAGELTNRLQGNCCAPLHSLGDDGILALLNDAALARLRTKASMFSARAKHCGWEQSLKEGLFAGLGYKQNFWPMRRLAESICNRHPSAKGTESEIVIHALLLGLGGLMPSEWRGNDDARDRHLGELWSVWWRLRDSVGSSKLPDGLWRFSGLRPANRPERRLALAAQWLADEGLVSEIEDWCEERPNQKDVVNSLRKILSQRGESFWDNHHTFASEAMSKSAPLIGGERINELAVNAILPWLFARAKAGRSQALVRRIETRYQSWPKSADNSVLRLARQRLLGTKSPRTFKTAAHQQGLLQIVRDFCARSDAVCTNCPFPNYVERLAVKG